MTPLGCKTDKRQGEDLRLTGMEEDFTIENFLDAVSKGRSVTCSQGKIPSKVYSILVEHEECLGHMKVLVH